MEILSDVPVVLQTVVVVVITLSFLLVGFNSLLNAKIDPLKNNQKRMESEIKNNQKRMESEIKNNQKRMESEISNVTVEQENIKNILQDLMNIVSNQKSDNHR